MWPGRRLTRRRVGEVVAHEAELALGVELPAVEADDARRFLAAMLQRVQAERGEGGGLRVAQDAEHAAFFVQRVAVQVEQDRGVGHRSPLSA